jgi:hypothetical protein
MNLIMPTIATILSVLVGFYIGKQSNCNCDKKPTVINLPKLKKSESVIYEEKKTPDQERSNYFYK